MPRSLRLDTRKGNQIENVLSDDPPTPGMEHEAREYRQKYITAQHRPTEVTRAYNCHGLTFASRRSAIWDSREIQKILLDDEYKHVDANDAKSGDVILYVSTNGELLHSGIVVSKEQFGVRVLSKWGGAHEVVHMAADCPYGPRTASYQFRRIVK